ncbi:MAG: tRNA dihydrouridine synthase DusB [Clostridia bacterium]|nr:tRNA dihydrouridine synthase DusB [Clostridia bacterium]
MFLHKLNIGNVELKNNVILAPMAGISDLPFRVICEKFGPGLTCTEMVSSKALYHDSYKTKKMMNVENEKRPISIQIFGSDIETMGFAAKEVSNFADILDINMGCPAPKIVKNGEGSRLLLDLDKCREIIRAVVQNSKVPVTVKMRKGWDNEHIVAVELAKIAEEEGAKAVIVHGRTRDEYYSGKVDKDIIKEVKEVVNIPVIASGDVVDEQTAIQMFEYTGCDGIMIGRGAIGNPWIFSQIIHILKTGEYLDRPSNMDKLEIIKEHYNLAVEKKGEDVAVKEMRKYLAYYTKNLKNSSEFRNRVNKLESKNDVIQALNEYFTNL